MRCQWINDRERFFRSNQNSLLAIDIVRPRNGCHAGAECGHSVPGELIFMSFQDVNGPTLIWRIQNVDTNSEAITAARELNRRDLALVEVPRPFKSLACDNIPYDDRPVQRSTGNRGRVR